MGTKTGIDWCDHTFNPWIGCQKVSPGCANCYAERLNKRYSWIKSGWGNAHARTSISNWRKVLLWASAAAKAGVIRRVFTASLGDIFDETVRPAWRRDFFKLVNESLEYKSLEWLILTKRPEGIAQHPIKWEPLLKSGLVRIGISAETQQTLNDRLQKLLWYSPLPNFVSLEPLLQEVSLPDQAIDWVICGSESGPGARHFEIDWARKLARQCAHRGIPFFLKQMPVDGKLTLRPMLDFRQYLEFPERKATDGHKTE